MIMIAVLHEVLLMVILPMLLPLIRPIKIDFQDIPNLAEHLSVMHFSQKFQWVLLLQGCFNFQNVIPCSCRRSCFWQGLFGSLSKKKREDSSCLPFVIFSMLWSWFTSLCHASSDTICSKDKNFEFYNSFPRFGAKSEIYYSWHCSLRIFAYLRGVVPYISSKFWVCLVQNFFPRESFHLWAFLWEISFLTTTSFHLYKACNQD